MHSVYALSKATLIDFNVYILLVHAFPGNQTCDRTTPILSDSTDNLFLVFIDGGKEISFFLMLTFGKVIILFVCHQRSRSYSEPLRYSAVEHKTHNNTDSSGVKNSTWPSFS